MKNVNKYEVPYFMPPVVTNDWVNKTEIEKAPIWCSVDLRDGNQALVEPMSLDEKIEFYKMLVEVGFREIEVGFPAASETEYAFLRTLIEQNMVPDDMTIQVLTQAREHIIKKTFEAVKGAKHAIIHLYNSTSVAQREQVFRKDKEQIMKIAVDGAKLLKKLADETEGNFSFEYSPESFTGTEMDYALEVCNAVLDVWQPTPDHKAIINLPATIENAMPHVFAAQVEYMHKNLKYRDSVIISVHPHNDRGTGVATAEVAVLAGADRVEGTLFGNGERTGNVDIVTMGMNMFSHGIDPGLDFSNMSHLRDTYEKLTGMVVPPRQPYAGALVFTAFSGSHQDAIAKGMAFREEKKKELWDVPYLPIDPMDVGRTYDSDVIRINSQSGKGGVAYILKQNFGMTLPMAMREQVGYAVKDVSDKEHKELSPEWVYQIFEERYIGNHTVFSVPECHFRQTPDGIISEVTIQSADKKQVVVGTGNGRLDAVSNAIKQEYNVSYELSVYEEHALSRGSSSKAVSYVGIMCDGKMFWGVGIHGDIINSSVLALVSAINQLLASLGKTQSIEERLSDVLSYIQTNYQTVTLEDLASHFHLSSPYLSKYIKEKSGSTFGEIVTEVRMKKAKTMLKNETTNVEIIAERVGYSNVEHFIRQFKKKYGMTPVQYRNQKQQ